MSQKVTRKTAVSEEKEKRQTDSPVKDMKKKMAANAEKEKQAAEKADKSTEKTTEKQTDKSTDKQPEKLDKNNTDKKTEKVEKVTEKPDKPTAADKKAEKSGEKKDQQDKSKEEVSKEDKSGKSEKSNQKHPQDSKPKQNGHNGVSDVTGAAGDVTNGTVSADSEDDDVMLVIDDQDQDELFPELTYDDASDGECFEPPTPDGAPSRSLTRRSQPKDSKVLKLKEDAPPTDRKLRSADSPKPKDKDIKDSKEDNNKDIKDTKDNKDIKDNKEAKKDSKKQDKESPKKQETEEKSQKSQEEKADNEKSQEDKSEKVEMEVVIEVEADVDESRSKLDTNYSKSRVKVSPYRRSGRIADQTNTSVMANYTGNNTTMEMDITETSSFIAEDTSGLDDSSYLRGLRSIRGRNSYKPLKEMTLRHITANRSTRSTALNASDSHSRPTGTVVGRKRKPDTEDVPSPGIEPASDRWAEAGAGADSHSVSKRMRILERLAVPFRRTSVARNPEIVGINTDLPLTAPVASAETFDPESLKPAAVPDPPIAVPLPTPEERESKRCLIM